MRFGDNIRVARIELSSSRATLKQFLSGTWHPPDFWGLHANRRGDHWRARPATPSRDGGLSQAAALDDSPPSLPPRLEHEDVPEQVVPIPVPGEMLGPLLPYGLRVEIAVFA